MPDGLHIRCCSHILVDSWEESLCNQADKYMKGTLHAPGTQHLDHMEMVDMGSAVLLALGFRLQGR